MIYCGANFLRQVIAHSGDCTYCISDVWSGAYCKIHETTYLSFGVEVIESGIDELDFVARWDLEVSTSYLDNFFST